MSLMTGMKYHRGGCVATNNEPSRTLRAGNRKRAIVRVCQQLADYSNAVLKYRSARSGRTVAMLPLMRPASCRAAQTLAPEEMPTSRP